MGFRDFLRVTPQSELSRNAMGIGTLFLAAMTITFGLVSLHAWRLGNERRDVALLGTFAGAFGVGAAIAALI